MKKLKRQVLSPETSPDSYKTAQTSISSNSLHSVIEQLNGKQLVMQLLGHDDPNVRYEALLAVQKLMVHNWEYLGKQLEKDSEKATGPSTAPISAK